jgi:hypothetical protein
LSAALPIVVKHIRFRLGHSLLSAALAEQQWQRLFGTAHQLYTNADVARRRTSATRARAQVD